MLTYYPLLPKEDVPASFLEPPLKEKMTHESSNPIPPLEKVCKTSFSGSLPSLSMKTNKEEIL